MTQIVIDRDINDYKEKPKKEPRRNFSGRRLFVHKLEYSTYPGDFFKSENRQAYIIAESFEVAKQMLLDSMGDTEFHLTSEQDSAFEIHALSPVMMKEIWREFNSQFDPETKRLRGK